MKCCLRRVKKWGKEVKIAFWIIILFTCLYEPIVGYFDFQKFKRDVTINEKARITYYIQTIIGLWIPTICILLFATFTDLTYEDIGLTWPTINTETLGPVITYTAFGITIFYLCVLVYYFVGYRYSIKIRNQFLHMKEKEKEKEGFSEILPTTTKEAKWWNYLSMTAAITEEIIYRGFLIFAFASLFPSLSIWWVILFASFLFGLAHTYQGIRGVFKTTMVGIVCSILSIGLGSILPLMVIHFVIDYVAKLGEEIVER